jgi:anti-sigma factor RsiW
MNRPSPLELMRYADGELPEGRAADVRAWLAGPSGQADLLQVEGIQQVGQLVRARAEETIPSPDLVDAVLADLDASGSPGPHPRVVSGGRGSPRRSAPLWWSLGAAGLAAAAAIALVLRSGSEDSGITRPDSLESRTAVGAHEPEAPGASIERLDPGAHGASVFVVQAGAVTTPVIWLLDDRDHGEDRMEPL